MGNLLEEKRALALSEALMAKYRSRFQRRTFAVLQGGDMASQATVIRSVSAGTAPAGAATTPAGAGAAPTEPSPTPLPTPSPMAPHAQHLTTILWAEVNLESLWEAQQIKLEATLLQEVTKLAQASSWDDVHTQMQVVKQAGDAFKLAKAERETDETWLEGAAVTIAHQFPDTVDYVREWIAALREQDYEPRKKLAQAFRRLVRQSHEKKFSSDAQAKPAAEQSAASPRAKKRSPGRKTVSSAKKRASR
jgi:hypothetical protein